jgi:hypothetical protein
VEAKSAVFATLSKLRHAVGAQTFAIGLLVSPDPESVRPLIGGLHPINHARSVKRGDSHFPHEILIMPHKRLRDIVEASRDAIGTID